MAEDIRISELSNVSSLGNNDLIEVSQVNAQSETGYDSKKATMLNVGDRVCNGIEYANALYTNNKKIIGAINELTTYIPVWNNTASGAIATFDTSLALPFQDCTIDINAVQESGTPTPDSPKLISGFTGANVTACGKNLFKYSRSTTGIFLDADGNEQSSTSFGVTEWLPVSSKGIRYRGATNFGTAPCTCYYDSNKTFISSEHHTVGDGNLTIPTSAVYFRMSFRLTDNTTLMIKVGTTPEDYEAYNGTTYAISWQDEAGTVYGGSLDVTSGVLTVTHAIVDMGSFAWNNASGNLSSSSGIATDVKAPSANTQAFNGLCSCYEVAARTGISDKQISVQTNGNIVISDTGIAGLTGEQVKTYVTGFNLVYELSTPVTYQLTPTQISAIVGTNNVFTDTNGDTSVVYACSLKDYIDGQ